MGQTLPFPFIGTVETFLIVDFGSGANQCREVLSVGAVKYGCLHGR